MALPLNLNAKKLLNADFFLVFLIYVYFLWASVSELQPNITCQKFCSFERRGKQNLILNFDLSLSSFRVKKKCQLGWEKWGWVKILRKWEVFQNAVGKKYSTQRKIPLFSLFLTKKKVLGQKSYFFSSKKWKIFNKKKKIIFILGIAW